ncbi:hypothetical protein [Micromonospora tarensis]|uniref:Uncharacterized protein n=1 Tax=Micromonospora tarensis TaxID=2806100 RepID=A0ABS1Y9N3_9ACTN|nr:hypothetical protein [Micromonospora tarensis]MBM0274099.1 hypothetical protein [Micromonospora tarensis]
METIGTLGAVVGGALFVMGLTGDSYRGDLLVVGALLVIAGLLLRIEAAVLAARWRGPNF